MLALWMAYSSDLQALLQIQPETKEDHSRPNTRGKHVFQSTIFLNRNFLCHQKEARRVGRCTEKQERRKETVCFMV